MFDLQLFLPGLLGYTASFVCPINENSGVSLPQRPPPFVFAIVWPILYLLIGYAFKNAKDKFLKKLFAMQIFLLTLWPVVFSSECGNDIKSSIYLLAIIIGLTVGIMTLHDKKLAVLSLIPLLSWCIIAFSLNFSIVFFQS